MSQDIARDGERDRVKAIPLWGKLLGGITLLAAACVGLTFIPTGEVAYAPSDPIDLSGKITVDGRPAESLQGRLYLVGVTEKPVNLLQRLLLDVSDPAVDFAKVPEGGGGAGPAQADVDAMAQAKRVAAGVAFDLAGKPVDWSGIGVNVAFVAAGTPAATVLQRGDIVVRVNGVSVDNSVDASRIYNQLKPGSEVELGVRRSGLARVVRMRTIAAEPGDLINRSRIGVALSTLGLKVNLPRDVEIDSGDVVGPSAGLAYALYLYDSLSPKDLLRGRHVVASGSVAPDGQVLAVGRMRQKAIAAQNAKRDVLIIPRANAREARDALADVCSDESRCIQVLPVRSAAEAVKLLELQPDALAARLASDDVKTATKPG